MPAAMISYRDKVMPNVWTGYYDNVESARMAINSLLDVSSKVDIRFTQLRDTELTAYYILLQDTLTQDHPTWSEMVDHWVWYLTENGYKCEYTASEGYAIMHEMLGVQRRDDLISSNRHIMGEQLQHALEALGVDVQL